MIIYGCYRVRRKQNKKMKDEVVEVNKYVNSHPVALADATRTHSANSISTVWTNIMSDRENGEGFEQNVGTFYENGNNVLTPRGLGFNGNFGKSEDENNHCLNISDEVEAEGYKITKNEEIEKIEQKRGANCGGAIPETIIREEKIAKRRPTRFTKADPSRSDFVSETAFSESESETVYDMTSLQEVAPTNKRMLGKAAYLESSAGLFQVDPMSPSEARRH